MRTFQHIEHIAPMWVGLSYSDTSIRAVSLALSSSDAAERRLNERMGGVDDPLRAEADHPLAREAFAQIQAYVGGDLRRFDLPLDLSAGTEFQRAVWRGCEEAPYGETRAYAWLAALIGQPQAGRAVGVALGVNPVPLFVPCHRIVRADGRLGGYSCGLGVKQLLLDLEQLHTEPAMLEGVG